MKLFEFNRDNYEITFSPELLTIEVFKKIVDRDKNKGKELAKKEISFIYFFTDIKSDYMYIADREARIKEIKNDLMLPSKWTLDNDLNKAISLYEERSTTVNTSLYKSACKSAIDISNYLNDTASLLAERDENGKVVTDIAKITGSLEKVPRIMANLNAAHTELIKEQKITEGRSKGSRVFNMFEDGLNTNE